MAGAAPPASTRCSPSRTSARTASAFSISRIRPAGLQFRRQQPRRSRIVDQPVRLGRPRPAVTVQGAFIHRRKVVPTGSYETTLDDSNSTVDSRGWLDAMVTGSFKGAALSGRAFVDFSSYHGSYVYLDGTSSIDTADGAWVGIEGTASRRIGDRHQVTTGLGPAATCGRTRTAIYLDPFQSHVDSHYQSTRRGLRPGRNPASPPPDRHRRRTLRLVEPYRRHGDATRRARLPHRRRHRHQGPVTAKPTGPRRSTRPTITPIRSGASSGRSGCAPPKSSTSMSFGGTLPLHRDRLRHPGEEPDSPTRRVFLREPRAGAVARNRGRGRTPSTTGSCSAAASSRNAPSIRSPMSSCRTRRAARRWSTRRRRCGAGSSRSRPSPQYIGHRFSTIGTPIDGVWLTNVNVTFVPPRRPVLRGPRLQPVRHALRTSGRLRVPPGPDPAGRPQRLGARHAALLSGRL